mgnify:CR=1 FL=1
MPNLEKKLLCFVQKHIAVLGIVCLLLVSAAQVADYLVQTGYARFEGLGVLG